MHLSSMEKMESFRRRFLSGKEDQDLLIYDLGSRAIGGSYHDLFSVGKWHYVGLDLTPGENVDIVLSDPYNWLEIDSRSADVFVSGQAFEHIEFFWVTIREIARVLKPGGLCCIITPSAGPEHKYPVDCWRFYPDGFRALSRYAGLELLEVDTEWEPGDYSDGSQMWRDTMFVGRKPPEKAQDTEDEHIYTREIRENSEDSLAKIVRYIEPKSRVLELGPATGYLTQFMTEKRQCQVDCVEISPEMARKAERFCNRMVVGDLDAMSLLETFQEESYDLIVLADILEHLRDGQKTLKSCRRLIKKEGRCVLSIPNIGHASVIGELLQGRFEYGTEGLLDSTHVRFFTRSTIQKMLRACGFAIESIEPVVRLPEETEFKDSLMDLPLELQRFILGLPDALTYQFIIVCFPQKDGYFSSPQEDVPEVREAVDLRRLVLAGFLERIEQTEEALLKAEELAYERLETINKLGEAFHEAQRLAYERLDRISELDKALQEAEIRIREYEQHLVNRVWAKARTIVKDRFFRK